MSGWEEMWSRGGGLKQGQAFDASGPLPFITYLFDNNLVPKGSGIIPGCGRGYAVKAFSRDGRNILGLEISNTAANAAKEYLSTVPQCQSSSFKISEGSFFEYIEKEKFDFAYDYTFLCAIAPSQRQAWAQKYAQILKPNGYLMTAVFPIGGDVNSSAGPPYAMSVELVQLLLGPHGFRKIFEKELGVGEAHPGREGKTTFCIWCR